LVLQALEAVVYIYIFFFSIDFFEGGVGSLAIVLSQPQWRKSLQKEKSENLELPLGKMIVPLWPAQREDQIT